MTSLQKRALIAAPLAIPLLALAWLALELTDLINMALDALLPVDEDELRKWMEEK